MHIPFQDKGLWKKGKEKYLVIRLKETKVITLDGRLMINRGNAEEQ